jgi:hypothetical protein
MSASHHAEHFCPQFLIIPNQGKGSVSITAFTDSNGDPLNGATYTLTFDPALLVVTRRARQH